MSMAFKKKKREDVFVFSYNSLVIINLAEDIFIYSIFLIIVK
jgi:hypothetical protein